MYFTGRYNNLLYFITGTTGSGKSLLAHELALKHSLKILSLDSMAIYKNLDILSAKPTKSMREEVEYFGLDIVEENTNFSVFDYLSYLSDIQLDKISHKEDILVVGGTGLYFNAVVGKYSFRKIDNSYRDQLEALSLESLQEIYSNNHPNKTSVDLKNKRRLIRAIESNNEIEYNNMLDFKLPNKNIGVFWDNPDYMENIHNRTHNMIRNGLADEIRHLDSPSRTIQQAIGYKEVLSINDEANLISEINKKTYKLVKKQRTWFKKIKNLIYLHTESENKILSTLGGLSNGRL